MENRQSVAALEQSWSRGRAGKVMVSIAVLLLSTSVFAESMPIRSGHAGHWYAADRSGEGWVLELRDAGGAWLYWFTYDDLGRQRWLTAAGNIVADGDSGERIDFSQLVVTRGARFGPDYDPNDVVHEAVGSASFRFDGCDSGQFSYEAFGQSQTFDVQRLARVMGTRCETPHGVVGRETAEYAGVSGSWYDPSHNGEGFAMHWATPNQAIVTWYSYDDEGNQYWMLGVGSVDRQGNVVFPDMHSTRGGRFGANFDPDQVERFEWGRLSLDLSCEGGYAEYSSPLAGFGDGSFELSRLTRLRLLPCPYSWPAFTELYELHSFVELPIGDAEPFEPSIVVHAQHVANDGSVVASRRVGEDNVGWQKQIWKDGKWMVIPGLGAGSTHFSDAGDAIAVGRLTEEGEPWVFLWTWSEGWTPLSGLAYPEANVTASSRNLQYLGGSSMPSPSASRTVKWIWHAEEGVRVLPEPDDWGALPMLIRRDGRRVLGRGMRSQGSTARPVAVIWEGDDLPHEIKDASGVQLGFLGGCDELCEIVFGSDQTYIDAGHPKTRQAWYWRGAGDSGYLGRAPDDALIGQAPYTVNGVIADGTVAVGGYSRFVGNELTGAGFVWTQATGLVPLSEILASWQVELEWISMSVSDISANGEWMLLSGLVKFDNPLRYGYRAALLRIQPKSNEW